MAFVMHLHRETLCKADRQLIANARPVRHWGRPFPADVPVHQEQQLARGFVGRKRAFGLGDLAQLPIVALDTIDGVDQSSDLGAIVKHGRQILPMRFP